MSFDAQRDLLFNKEPEEPENKEPGEGTGTPTPAALTAEDVAAQIALATQPLQHELELTQERLRASQAMAEQVQHTRQPGTPAVPREERTGDEYVEEFTADALGATKSVAQEEIDKRMQNLEPVLQRQHETIHQTLVNSERLQVETEYGKEAWELYIEPLLNVRMAGLRDTNLLSMADPDVVRNEVLSIMGHKRNELAAVKVKQAETVKEAETARYDQIRQELNMGGMVGGTTAPMPKIDAPLSAEDLDFVQSKKNAGQTVDIHKLRKTVGAGATSWGAWKAAQEAK
jgi:hypothetical protein